MTGSTTAFVFLCHVISAVERCRPDFIYESVPPICIDFVCCDVRQMWLRLLGHFVVDSCAVACHDDRCCGSLVASRSNTITTLFVVVLDGDKNLEMMQGILYQVEGLVNNL